MNNTPENDLVLMNEHQEDTKEMIFGKANKKRLNRLVEIIPENTNLLVDIGCSHGYITDMFRKKAKKVIGIDFVPAHIEQAKALFPDVEFVVGDAVNFTLNEPVDVIVASEIIEHAKNPEIMLNNFYNNLKQGGVLIITTPNSRSFSKRIKLALGMKADSVPAHLSYFTKKSLQEILIKCGFKIDLFSSNKEISLKNVYVDCLNDELSNTFIVRCIKGDKIC